MAKLFPFNPALNLESFAVQSPNSVPPNLNALYLRDGKYDGMGRADVTATFAAFRSQTETDRLALFFHGGLVDKTSGQQSAANEYAAYRGFAFPLFFIWESGFQEVLAHHLPLIFAETIFGRVLHHAWELVSGKVAPEAETAAGHASGSAESGPSLSLSDTEIHAFMTAIKTDIMIQNEAVSIARTSESVDAAMAEGIDRNKMMLSPRTLMSPEVVGSVRGAFFQANPNSIGSAGSLETLPFSAGGAIQAAFAIAKAAVPVLLNTVRRFAQSRDHGLQCTLVEEILRALYLANFGSAIWEEMKKETEDAFGADSNVFGGTAVIEELCQVLKDKPQIKVTLIGHSTGGVYIGNFLHHVDAALRNQNDVSTQFDVILLAPANTDDFFQSRYVQSRIRGIRLFEMKDAVEQQDHLLSKDVGPEDPSILGQVYPRSLLYLVSGVCEYFEGNAGPGPHAMDGFDMPLLGMDRYFSQQAVFQSADYPSVDAIRKRFPSPPVSHNFARVLSPTDGTAEIGFRCTSQKHGNFPGDPFTIESLRFCFKNGL